MAISERSSCGSGGKEKDLEVDTSCLFVGENKGNGDKTLQLDSLIIFFSFCVTRAMV
jgi:hypothetical protein